MSDHVSPLWILNAMYYIYLYNVVLHSNNAE